MTRRTPAAVRFVVPAALVVFALAFAYVLMAGGGGSKSAQPAKPPAAARSPATAGHRSHRSKRTYVVKTGDSLASIARKTGVGVRRLQELNPDVDPQLLSPGQRLKLR